MINTSVISNCDNEKDNEYDDEKDNAVGMMI